MNPFNTKNLYKTPSVPYVDTVTGGHPLYWEYYGVVTPEKLTNPDQKTDLMNYAAFQAAVPMVQQMNIAGASAGQLLRVKTINNNGNPTAWETVNVSTEVSNSSTNDELATAKAVYDAITAAIGNIDTLVGTGEVTT